MKTTTLLSPKPFNTQTAPATKPGLTLFVILLFLKLGVFAQTGTPTITANGPTTFCEGSSVTLNGSVTPLLGNALNFNGITYGNLSGNTATGLNLQTSTFTIECWAKPTSTDHQLLYYQGQGCVACPGVALSIGNERTCPLGGFVPGKWSFRFDSPGQRKDLIANSNVVLNQWTHIAVTYDGATLKMYLNGVFETSIAAAGLANNNNVFYLGGDPDWCAGTRYMYTGQMDEFRIWNTTRTAADITNSYNKAVSVSSPGLLAYYNFEETATALNDVTGHGSNGFISSSSMRVASTAPLQANWGWSNANNTNTLNVTSSGSYQAAVINPNGFVGLSNIINVNVGTYPESTITTSGSTEICDGGSVTLTAPVASTYLWSNGATTQSINVTSAGNYSVTASNGICSTPSNTVTVKKRTNPSAGSITGTTSVCNGTASVPIMFDNNPSVVFYNYSCDRSTVPTSSVSQTFTAPSSGYITTVAFGSGAWCSTILASTTISTPSQTVNYGGLPYTSNCYYAQCATGNNMSYTTLPGNGFYVYAGEQVTISFVASGSMHYQDGILRLYITGKQSIAATQYTYSINGGSSQTVNSSGSSTSAQVMAPTSTDGNFVYTLLSVTDNFGCVNSTQGSATITIKPKPVATASSNSPVCVGDTIKLSGSGPGTYSWIGPGFTSSQQNPIRIATSTAMGGNYTLTPTLNGCNGAPSTVSVVVNARPAPTITTSGPTTFCDGGNVYLSAANVPTDGSYQLNWSHGTFGSGTIITYAGNYSLTAISPQGCSGKSAPVTVTVNPNPTPTITTGGPTTFCDGGNVYLAAASVPLDGSYQLNWSHGTFGSGTIITYAGNYAVTAISPQGCSGTSAPVTVIVNPNPTPTITAGGPTTFCDGGNVYLAAASVPLDGSYQLNWSHGTFGSGTIITYPGNYSVTAISPQGCSGTSAPVTVTVNPNPTPTITAGGPTTFCDGGNVYLAAASVPLDGSYQLNWSHGTFGSGTIITYPGNYSVTAISPQGCSGTSAPVTVTVNPNPTPTITAGGPTTFCDGGNVYLAAASVPLDGSYDLNWSHGTFGSGTIITYPGNYSVTAISPQGCSGTSAPVTVTVNPNPTPTITAGGPTTFCDGGNVYLAAASVPLDGSYDLNWSHGTFGSGTIITYAGNYSVTAISPQGCSGTSAPVNVTVNPNPTPIITAGGPTTFCDGGNVYLAAASVPLDGSYQLNWSHGTFGSGTIITYAGNYAVTAISPQGCSGTSAPVTVTVNPNPVAAATSHPVTCSGGNDGSILVSASNGTSPYEYSVNNALSFQSGSLFQNLAEGPYNVNVKDIHGCQSASIIATITQLDTIKPVVVTQNIIIGLNSSGQASITVAQINDGSTDNCGIESYSLDQTSFTCSNVGSNIVTLTVTDVNGNSSSATATVTVQDQIAPTPVTKNISVTLSNGMASVTASQIDDGSNDNCAIADLAVSPNMFTCGNIGPNTVTFTVTDANGNTASKTAVVTVIGAIPSAGVTQSTQPVFSQGGAVVLTASSPTATDYSWSGGPSTPVYYVYASGIYTVTATNQYGCTVNASTTVTYSASNLLSSYTIIGKDKVELKDHVKVYNGGVGVTSSCGEAEIENYSTVNAAGTFVRAKDIDVKYNSSVSTKIFSAVPTSILPTFLSNPYCNGNNHSCKHSHHNSCSHNNNNNGCGNNNNCSHSHHNNCSNNIPNNKNVNQNANVTITDSIMGTVVIGKNATVTFTSASLYIKDLEIKDGATVHFTKCAVIRVCNHVKMDQNVSFNSTTPVILAMYIEKKLDVDYGTELNAHVYAKDKVTIDGKSSAPTTITGLIIGESVSAEKYVSFYWNTTTVCPAGYSKTDMLAQEDGLLDEYFEAEMYPNPASSFFNIRLLSSSAEPFSIEVYDMNGRLIESQTSSQLSLYNEMGQAYSDGVYFVKITQGEHNKTLRLIKANR